MSFRYSIRRRVKLIEGPKHGRLHATRTKGHNSLRGSYVLLIFISLRSLAKPNETKVGAGAGERAFFASKLKCWARGIFEIHEANFRPIRRMEAEKACIMYANKCQHVLQMQRGRTKKGCRSYNFPAKRSQEKSLCTPLRKLKANRRLNLWSPW